MEKVLEDYPFPSVQSMRVNTTPETRRSDCIKILLFLRAIAKEVETRLKHRKYKPDEMGDAKAFIQHTTLMMKELQVNWEGWVYQFDDDDIRNQLKVEPLSVAEYAEDCFLSLAGCCTHYSLDQTSSLRQIILRAWGGLEEPNLHRHYTEP